MSKHSKSFPYSTFHWLRALPSANETRCAVAPIDNIDSFDSVSTRAVNAKYRLRTLGLRFSSCVCERKGSTALRIRTLYATFFALGDPQKVACSQRPAQGFQCSCEVSMKLCCDMLCGLVESFLYRSSCCHHHHRRRRRHHHHHHPCSGHRIHSGPAERSSHRFSTVWLAEMWSCWKGKIHQTA